MKKIKISFSGATGQKEPQEILEKAVTYTGPMSVSDISLASWNEFFREGGSLNQPRWLESNRVKDLKTQFTRLARYHQKV